MKGLIAMARIVVIIIFFGLAFLALYLSFFYEAGQWVIVNTLFGRFLAHMLINIAPELAGIIIGVVTIDYLNERRQDEQLKRQLILQMGSRHNDVTDMAIRSLRSHEWLHDGTLRMVDLSGANLKGVDLSEANLKKAYLVETDLENANLGGANLKKINLWGSNLERSYMRNANLSEANLRRVNFKHAHLSEVNFSGANLEKANLEGAILYRANLEGVNLRGANLKGVKFGGANLKNAVLSEAILDEVNFEEANLEGVWSLWKHQAVGAWSLRDAIMPDGRKYEEWSQNPDDWINGQKSVEEKKK